MNEEGWHTVCHTCFAEHVSADYDEASAFAGWHGEQGHDVEMLDLFEGVV